jgi:PTH1 family peptidyl-tRNA hydrolase
MLLLVGLGNPGRDYAGHRHNVGFMALDAIAARHRFGPWRKQFKAEIAEGAFDTAKGRVKVLALKPQTFMNLSGEAVQAAAQFYKIPMSDIAVLYDELDLAEGRIRVKTGGGAAGHNGIRSIAGLMGPDFRRVRIGIGHPGDKSRVTGHVLGNFSKDDRTWLEPMLDAIADAAPYLATGDDIAFMNRIAVLRGEPQDEAKPKKNKADKPAVPLPPPPAGESLAPTGSGLARSDRGGTARSDTTAPSPPPTPSSPFSGLLGRLLGNPGKKDES